MNFYEAQTLDEITNPNSTYNNRDKQYIKARRQAVPEDAIVSSAANMPKIKQAAPNNIVDQLTNREFRERQQQKKDAYDQTEARNKAKKLGRDKQVDYIRADASKKRIWYNPMTWNPTAGLWTRLKHEVEDIGDAKRPDFELR